MWKHYKQTTGKNSTDITGDGLKSSHYLAKCSFKQVCFEVLYKNINSLRVFHRAGKRVPQHGSSDTKSAVTVSLCGGLGNIEEDLRG